MKPSTPSVLFAALTAMCVAAASADSIVAPFGPTGAPPAAPWKLIGLPGQTKPFTRFQVAEVDGHHALRVEADASYGNVVDPLQRDGAHLHLAWQWRVEELVAASDLTTRQGDDTALKVCTLWDMPLDAVPFVERQLLKVARGRSADPLPAATVCYVWDAHLAIGTTLDNAFTRRLRYVVLRSGDAPLHAWTGENRDIAADFMTLFGSETKTLPPLVGIAIGADADNTRGHSVGMVADLQLQP